MHDNEGTNAVRNNQDINQNIAEQENLEILKNITTQDFLALGISDMAYIRKKMENGRAIYAIHAADGTPLSIMDSENEAVSAILQNDMDVVTRH